MGVGFLIYLIGIIGNISKFFEIIIIVMSVICAFLLMFYVGDSREYMKEEMPYINFNFFKKFIGLILILSLVRVAIPTKESLVGIVTVPYLLETTNIKELPKETVDAILRILRDAGVKNSSLDNSLKKNNSIRNDT